jgi:deoxyribodipyrimidine photo-lyase
MHAPETTAKEGINLFWFRRDLRINDNTGLYKALSLSNNVQPVFIFDTEILDDLEDQYDRRVSFIYEQIEKLKSDLESRGSTLWVYYGKPIDVFTHILGKHQVRGLYANKDYEPYARNRDEAVYKLFQAQHLQFKAYKDHVIFEKDEILKDDGSPYVVYTPYSKKWKAQFEIANIAMHNPMDLASNLHKTAPSRLISLEEMGFKRHPKDWTDPAVDLQIVKQYHQKRDLPAVNGTTRISVHLRFGTISVREMAQIGHTLNEKWFNELIWREFYQSILWHYPHVVGGSFRKEYDHIPWRNNVSEFQAWCDGKTGYPIVDAGMTELNKTGFMHNRVRMIVASFLTKHLLIDWRWGEAYFARKLLDFELASNNGGWQWAAGCGVDAAPYFRVFNPELQTDKFDKDWKYIKKWVPNVGTSAYPKPIVDHKLARNRALETYKTGLGKP